MSNSDDATARLEPFLGRWAMEAIIPGMAPGEARADVTFEWLPQRSFVLERWEVPIPGVPDGLAVIGFNAARGPTCSTTSTPAAWPGSTR